MKKIAFLIISFVLAFTMLACGEASSSSQNSANENAAITSGKILVAYFSATGNTKTIAEYASQILGADIYEIVPAIPYTEEDLNYNDPTTRATLEQGDDNARPEILENVENMDQYDTIIIAYPIWWGKEPRIIDTFVESYDFSGKTITTLCTSGSTGIETSVSDLKELIPSATWLESKRFEAGSDKESVESWLKQIGLVS